MDQKVVEFVRKHPHLWRFDFRVARWVGAPKGHTLSGYAYKAEQARKPWGKFWRPLIDTIFRKVFGQLDHCKKAWQHETVAILAGKPLTGWETV